jgi:hypothetical protein
MSDKDCEGDKKDEIGEAWTTHRRNEKYVQNLIQKSSE